MKIWQILGIILLTTYVGTTAEILVPRDPFLPLFVAKSGAVAQSAVPVVPNGVAVGLKGIVWDASTPIAILEIAGTVKSMGIGDTASGVSVSRIERQQVLLNRHGKISILKLGSNTSL